MKIDFTDVLFRKKSEQSDTPLLGQVLGDISCEALVMGVLKSEEANTLVRKRLVIAELPPSEDEEE